jgi:lipopolysaccharide transport system ATP-binding protein
MIRTAHLSKRYTLYDRPTDRLRDWISPGRRRRREFWALRDLTIEVARGTSLGVVGVNGAGKSTLLKILTGTTVPTSGHYEIDGRVSALLELGMGFQTDLTGRENVALNGKLAGLSGEELEARTPAIIDFSELGAFIDQPLRTYSSGMLMRLAFSLAASVDPDVLIVDEALSVGDLHFQQKCLRRIREFHERGITVLFVSHDPAMIKTFCDEAILLDAGSAIDRGRPSDVLDHYNALLAEKHREDGPKARIVRPGGAKERNVENDAAEESEESKKNAAGDGCAPSFGHRAGNFQAVITRVDFTLDESRGGSEVLTPGARATILVRAVAIESIPAPTVGILIKDRLGNEVFGVNTAMRGVEIGEMEAGGAIEARFRCEMDLGAGAYTITAALHEGVDHTQVCYDWIEAASAFHVIPSPAEPFTGVCRLAPEIRVTAAAADPEELRLAKLAREG